MNERYYQVCTPVQDKRTVSFPIVVIEEKDTELFYDVSFQSDVLGISIKQGPVGKVVVFTSSANENPVKQVRDGDILDSIDGVTIEPSLSFTEIRDRIRSIRKRPLTLTFRRSVVLWRQHSDFSKLVNSLRAGFPGIILPQLPAKNPAGLSPDERAWQMNACLQQLKSLPPIATSHLFEQFLSPDQVHSGLLPEPANDGDGHEGDERYYADEDKVSHAGDSATVDVDRIDERDHSTSSSRLSSVFSARSSFAPSLLSIKRRVSASLSTFKQSNIVHNAQGMEVHRISDQISHLRRTLPKAQSKSEALVKFVTARMAQRKRFQEDMEIWSAMSSWMDAPAVLRQLVVGALGSETHDSILEHMQASNDAQRQLFFQRTSIVWSTHTVIKNRSTLQAEVASAKSRLDQRTEAHTKAYQDYHKSMDKKSPSESRFRKQSTNGNYVLDNAETSLAEAQFAWEKAVAKLSSRDEQLTDSFQRLDQDWVSFSKARLTSICQANVNFHRSTHIRLQALLQDETWQQSSKQVMKGASLLEYSRSDISDDGTDCDFLSRPDLDRRVLSV